MNNEWMSLEDSFPETGKEMLCIGINEDGEFLAPIVATLHSNGRFICGYSFQGGRDIGFYFETFPTHWMLLPDAPKDSL